ADHSRAEADPQSAGGALRLSMEPALPAAFLIGARGDDGMTMQNDGFDASRRATSEDVRRMLGDLEDVTVAEILSSQPTIGEVADAAVWARGDGDLAAHEHKE